MTSHDDFRDEYREFVLHGKDPHRLIQLVRDVVFRMLPKDPEAYLDQPRDQAERLDEMVDRAWAALMKVEGRWSQLEYILEVRAQNEAHLRGLIGRQVRRMIGQGRWRSEAADLAAKCRSFLVPPTWELLPHGHNTYRYRLAGSVFESREPTEGEVRDAAIASMPFLLDSRGRRRRSIDLPEVLRAIANSFPCEFTLADLVRVFQRVLPIGLPIDDPGSERGAEMSPEAEILAEEDKQAAQDEADRTFAVLTPEQRTLVRALTLGKTDQQIAEDEGTVGRRAVTARRHKIVSLLRERTSDFGDNQLLVFLDRLKSLLAGEISS
jgi:hypothetical protein